MRRCAIFLGLSLLAPGAARATEPNVITRVAVEEHGADVLLVVEGSRPPSFTTWSAGQRFVVEVAGARLRAPASALSRESGAIAGVHAEERASVGATKTRVAVTLRGDAEGAEVTTRDNTLVVAFKDSGAGAEPVAAAETTAAPAETSTPTATSTPTPTPTATPTPTPTPAPTPAQQIRELGFRPLPDGARVYLRTANPPRFAVEERSDTLFVVKLDRASARPNDVRPLDLRFFAGPVARVTPRRVDGAYVLEIALREKVPYEQRVEGGLLAIDFRTPVR